MGKHPQTKSKSQNLRLQFKARDCNIGRKVFATKFLFRITPLPGRGCVRRIGSESLSEQASSSTETERNNRPSSSKTQKSPSIFQRKAGENKPSSEKEEKINHDPLLFQKSRKCVEVQTPRCTNFSFRILAIFARLPRMASCEGVKVAATLR